MDKVSLIVTVLNEEKTILKLLKSIVEMSLLPEEVIIVDGGSSDKTVEFINKFVMNFSNKNSKFEKNNSSNKISKSKNLKFKVFIQDGNRSIGRNLAISKSKNNWIAITDAGCILDKNWLKELLKKQRATNASVVAGYYKAIAKTPFEKAVVPYVLVMPDQVDENNFLPATRSVLISKEIWKEAGGFDEKLSDNEDYAFAKKIVQTQKIVFAKDAVVSWIPRSTLKGFAKMVFRFSRGDIYAGIIRPKVVLIFVRYLIGFLLVLFGFVIGLWQSNFWFLFGLIFIVLTTYNLWSIYKNYRYVSRGKYWLPVLQISSDLMVMWGSVCGVGKRLNLKRTYL